MSTLLDHLDAIIENSHKLVEALSEDPLPDDVALLSELAEVDATLTAVQRWVEMGKPELRQHRSWRLSTQRWRLVLSWVRFN